MALTLKVQRGYTFSPDIPWSTDDLNAAALPVIVLEGTVGSADLGGASVTWTHTVPGPHFFGAASGSAGNFILTLNPAPIALVAGLWVCFLANHGNTGPVTLNVNALGQKSVLTPGGEALTGGEIHAGQLCWVQYDGTQWQILSERSLPRTLYAVDSGVANAYAIALPAIEVTSYNQLLGQEIIFKAAAANTGGSTLNVNGLGAQPITKQGSTALSASDIQTGGLVSVAWDGARWQMTSFVAAPALPAVGAVGTQLYPYSITVDAQGRVTGRAGGVYVGASAIPTGGAAQAFTHGLGRTPAWVRVVAVMGATTEGGYPAGWELDVTSIYGGPVPDEPQVFSFGANGTVVNVSLHNDSYFATTFNGAGQFAFTPALWTLKVYAW